MGGDQAAMVAEDSSSRSHGETFCNAGSTLRFCEANNLPCTEIMRQYSLEDLIETLDASAQVAVALFNAGLDGDPGVDPDAAQMASDVLRRIRKKTGVLERGLLRRTCVPECGGQEWVDMYMGARRRYKTWSSLSKKVQAGNRVVKHWVQQKDISKDAPDLLSCSPHPSISITPSLDVESWDGTDVFKLNEKSSMPLTHVFMAIWRHRNFDSLSQTSPSQVLGYIKAIESKYLENPYHNRMHAADVVAAAYYILSKVERQAVFDGYFNSPDLLAVLLAGAIHDVAHPGLSNDFLVKTKSPMAMRYNDKSILENMHLATAFELMQEHQIDLLEHKSSSPPAQALRGRVIEMVLATDMAMHKSLVEKFATDVDNCDNRVQDVDKIVFEQMILHMADIGHPLRPAKIHRQWSVRITEEFLSIGDMEKELGLTPVELFDRERAPPLAQGQVGFLTFVVQPAWNTLARALGPAAKHPTVCFENNLNMWEAEVDDTKEVNFGKTLFGDSCSSAFSLRSIDERKKMEGLDSLQECADVLRKPTTVTSESSAEDFCDGRRPLRGHCMNFKSLLFDGDSDSDLCQEVDEHAKSKVFSCRRCGRGVQGESIVTRCNERFHPECFKCARCNDVIVGEYRVEGPDTAKYSLNRSTRNIKYRCLKCAG